MFSHPGCPRESRQGFCETSVHSSCVWTGSAGRETGGDLQGVHVRASEGARQVPGVPGQGGSSGQQGGASREERGGGIQGEGGQDDARPRFPRQHAASSGPRCGPVRHATTCTSRAWPGGGSLSRTLVSAPRPLTALDFGVFAYCNDGNT